MSAAREAPGAQSGNWLPAEQLNSSCFCSSLDRAMLKDALSGALGNEALFHLVEERCPYLFSSRPVFVSKQQTEQIRTVVQAIESVIAMPAYRARVLADAPAVARQDPGARGAFFGYDFHLNGERLGLIEINTNAGGAMLNATVARAHRACCLDHSQLDQAVVSGAVFETAIVQMFQAEWALANRDRPLRTIAIVDTAPEQQYLYPEFLLFQRLFANYGMEAVITDPAGLAYRDGALWAGARAIDLVYNRLTDFMLDSPESQALRQAYLACAVVLTPHPQAHALYANKRNLAILSNAAELERLGVAPDIRSTLLAHVPFTELVDRDNADRLWSERRNLFFKPVAGYGGRAAYRGDKLTKRVWDDILGGDYIAQHLVAPGQRVSGTASSPENLKFDLRSYVYHGQVQWTAARVYQGQTTNFRTPGGGFAPVYSLDEAEVAAEIDAIGHQDAALPCCPAVSS